MLNLVKGKIQRLLHLAGFEIQRAAWAPSNLPWLKAFDIRTILDVGAHTGSFTRSIRKVLPDATIYAFEPLPDRYEELVANSKDLRVARAFNVALGAEDGEMEIYRNAFTPSSSLLRMTDLHKEAFPFTTEARPETIRVRRLDGLAGELTLQDDVMIKIDVQGYEHKVIEGGSTIVSRARVLLVETSFAELYEGQPLFADIFDLLRGRGFSYCGNLEQTRHPVNRQILQADSLFIRNPDRR